MKTILQIVADERVDNINVSGNITDVAKICFILDKVKLQILMTKNTEPSLIQPVGK